MSNKDRKEQNPFKQLFERGKVAKGLLAPDQRDLYDQYFRMYSQIRAQYVELYPKGIPGEIEDSIGEQAYEMVPGSREVIEEFINIEENLAAQEGKDNNDLVN